MSSKKIDYQALNLELDDILRTLQSGELDIDEAITSYERGQQIISELEDYIKQSENKIIKLKNKNESIEKE